MKILLGHVATKYSINSPEKIAQWINRLKKNGFDVDSFCLSHDITQPIIYWPELDEQWRTGNKCLLTMYESLAEKLESYDIFVNYNGINLHPDFIQKLPTFNVYACFDDPESSEKLSKPVAWAYDLAMIGNIAEVDKYKEWGVREARFWPMGFRSDDFEQTLTKEIILNGERDVDITMLCEHVTNWRRDRLDKFATTFPKGAYYGLGWPNGFLRDEEFVPLLLRTKIGINIHNSTGPINLRTYYLPANGVLQICDNKSFLSHIFDLNKEVVGFDTIDEAIDLTRYYLHHDRERRELAANGWEKATKEYNEIAVFKRLIDAATELIGSQTKSEINATIYLKAHRKLTRSARVVNTFLMIFHAVRIKVFTPFRLIKKLLKLLHK